MKKIILHCALAAVAVVVSSCAQRMSVVGMERSRILVDARYDGVDSARVADIEAFMKPYTAVVDSMMSPVVGRLEVGISSHAPESPLSNLLADILVWAGSRYGERPVMGVYNMGGIRASLSAGDVTYGDVLEVAPFTNKICFLTLSGESLMELFRQIAAEGGEGVSHGVKMIITKDGELRSATLHGRAIDPKASYRIATIDYLAAGNDGMTAFKQKIDLNAPAGKENDSREVICEYFRSMAKAKREIRPMTEGRIIIEE